MHNNDLITSKKLLKKGKLVIFPTETVFGIGADATNSKAITKIYKIKKRPLSNPLICHFKNLSQIKEHFILTKLDYKIAKLYWPGPLTLILEKKQISKISSPSITNSFVLAGPIKELILGFACQLIFIPRGISGNLKTDEEDATLKSHETAKAIAPPIQ